MDENIQTWMLLIIFTPLEQCTTALRIQLIMAPESFLRINMLNYIPRYSVNIKDPNLSPNLHVTATSRYNSFWAVLTALLPVL